MKPIKILILTLTAFAFLISACSDTGNNDGGAAAVKLVEDIPGNVNTLTENNAPVEDINDHPDSEHYTFYDLNTGVTVADSASAEWDIAFNKTTIIANSGHGGGILVAESSFDELTEAPESGYEAQTEAGSWYTYTGMAPGMPQHAVLPREDRTIVVLTPDLQYAKVEIVSYYEGNPDPESEEFQDPMNRAASGYFTFNYTLQNIAENTSLHHTDRVTYFDLDTEEIVQDSSSSQWDIGFAGTTIYANADNDGGILSLRAPFADVDEAPTSGYTENVSDWYIYTGENPSGPPHAILANEDVTLLVKTPAGNYAKIKILSYYKGNPSPTDASFIDVTTRPESRYFTFEYALQTDGSVHFE